MDIKDLNQLSTGNIVFEHYGGHYEVETIHGSGFLDLRKPGCTATGRYAATDVRFVILNADWLTKFGYVQQPWGWVKEGSPLINFAYHVELGNGFRINLLYIHQLQNLIRLTGKELTTATL